MQTVNQIFLLGNIGRKPEITRFDNGAKTKLSLATNIGVGANQTTQWHTVIFNNKDVAESVAKLNKGDVIHVQGYMNYRKWRDSNGNTHISPEVVALNYSSIPQSIPQSISAASNQQQPVSNQNFNGEDQNFNNFDLTEPNHLFDDDQYHQQPAQQQRQQQHHQQPAQQQRQQQQRQQQHHQQPAQQQRQQQHHQQPAQQQPVAKQPVAKQNFTMGGIKMKYNM